MKLDFIQIISIFTVFQILTLVIYFTFFKSNKLYIEKLLSSLLLIFSIQILSSFLFCKSFFLEFFNLAYLGNNSLLLLGPFIFFYLNCLINQKNKIAKIQLIHFLPFFLHFGYSFIKISLGFDILLSKNDKIIFIILSFSQFIYYLVIILKKYFHEDVKNKISTGSLIIISSFVFLWIEKIILNSIWTIPYYFPIYLKIIDIYFLSSFILLNALLYISLKNNSILSGQKKYQNSVLSSINIDDYKNKLLNYMEEEKPFLDSEISLNTISQNTDIPRRYLSQILNEVIKLNFYDFINKYRIEESKKLLLDSLNKKTVIEIIYEVGFNSKSTFNNAFKKFTGVTPKEFKSKENKN